MCISDKPPTFCDASCGHLQFPPPEALLSLLEDLPQLPVSTFPPGTDIGEGRTFEHESLLNAIDSASQGALDLAIRDPDTLEELSEQTEIQELALEDRFPAASGLSVRDLLKYLYPSDKEPRFSLCIKTPAKNAMLRQSTVQCVPYRVKIGIVNNNMKMVKLNCRLFLRLRLFYSTSPVKEVENRDL